MWCAIIREFMDVQAGRAMAIDREFPRLGLCAGRHAGQHGSAAALVDAGRQWSKHIPLLPGKIYMTPSGFKVRMEKHPARRAGGSSALRGEGTFCHKPCTVSGGGKSEISKSLRDYMIYGPIFVADIERELDHGGGDLQEGLFRPMEARAARASRHTGQRTVAVDAEPANGRWGA